MALMVVHSGTSGMESISDVPCYLVLNYLTWSLICITVHQNFKGREAVLPHASFCCTRSKIDVGSCPRAPRPGGRRNGVQKTGGRRNGVPKFFGLLINLLNVYK